MKTPVKRLLEILSRTKGKAVYRDWIIGKVTICELIERKAINHAYNAGLEDGRKGIERNYYKETYLDFDNYKYHSEGIDEFYND